MEKVEKLNISTIAEIDELIEETKDLPLDELSNIALSLYFNVSVLYCLRMMRKYEIKIPI